MDPLAEKYYSISPYAYCLNNPLRYTDPTGMDTVPSNEVWEYDLINYRSDGMGLYDTENYTTVQNEDGEIFHLHSITSGENEGNYMAIQQYGKNEDGYEVYEYKYVVGKDKVDDFKEGETKGSGFLRGAVKLAVDGGMDGRASFVENVKTHLKNQYSNPLTLLFDIGTKNPMNPKDWIPSISKKSIKQPISTTIKTRTWNQFQLERKGMYTKKNYGTSQDAAKARSRDYQRWKNK